MDTDNGSETMIATDTKSNQLTNSRANTFKTCARKHFFSYELGIRRASDATPLRFGSAVHVGLHAWKGGATPEEAIVAAVTQFDATRPNDDAGLIEREQIARLLSGYFWRWSAVTMEVIDSEIPFDVDLVNPETGRSSRLFTEAGVIDAIVRLPDGRLALMEHKTTGSGIEPESDYWQRLLIDSQISIYWAAAHAKGHAIETTIYDVIRKPTIKPKAVPQGKIKLVEKMGAPQAALQKDFHGIVEGTQAEIFTYDTYFNEPCEWNEWLTMPNFPGETSAMYGARLTHDIGQRPDYYYARQEIPRLPADLDEGAWDVWQTAKMIRECQKFNRWPRNTSACIGFGRCEYFNLCTGGYDPTSSETPDGFVVVDNVHSELS